ncbi:MAG: S6e family ribosomal protein, partial [Candidatus Aenigmatarchaeota archaeon]
MKVVISMKGQAMQREMEAGMFSGKKIGEKVSGANFPEMEGYEFEITGGSDREGFPMRKGVSGQVRKRLLLAGGVGYNPKGKGVRRRKGICGEVVSDRTAQVNLKVIKEGNKKFGDFFKKDEPPAAEGSE